MVNKAVYEVVITETLEKVVYIAADTPEEALQIAEYEYYDKGNIVLDSDNYTGETDISVIGVSDEDPDF